MNLFFNGFEGSNEEKWVAKRGQTLPKEEGPMKIQ